MTGKDCNPSNYFQFVDKGEPVSTIETGLLFVDEMLGSFDDYIVKPIDGIIPTIDQTVTDLDCKIDVPIDTTINEIDSNCQCCDSSMNVVMNKYGDLITNTYNTILDSFNTVNYDLSTVNIGGNTQYNYTYNETTQPPSCPPVEISVRCEEEETEEEEDDDIPPPPEPEPQPEPAPEDEVDDEEEEEEEVEPPSVPPPDETGTGQQQFCSVGPPDSDPSEMFAFLNAAMDSIVSGAMSAVALGRSNESLSSAQTKSSSTNPATIYSSLFGDVPNWKSDRVCDYLAECQVSDDKCRKFVVTAWFWKVTHEPTEDRPLRCVFRPYDWYREAFAEVPLVGDAIGELIFQVGWRITKAVDELIHGVSRLANCDFSRIGKPIIIKIIAGSLKKWTGIEIPKLDSLLTRWIDYTCPENMPSTPDAIQAYLGNEITHETMLCWARANNDIPEHVTKIAHVSRLKLSPDEAFQMYLRGNFNRDHFIERCREAGDVDGDIYRAKEELGFQTPTVSDLIPFMLRDVFDPNVVRDLKLDAEFTQKYTDEAKKLFRAAGIRDEHAKLHWMSHWNLASNTQLYEMFHRLRGGPGDSEFFRYYDDEGKPLETPVRITNEELKITDKDIVKMLGINDVLPSLRERFLAISRPPLTRVDIRRAFEIDAITENQVLESYKDLGYSDTNAKILLDFTRKLKQRGNVQKQGRMRPSKVASLYKTKALTKAEAKELLKQSGLDDEASNETLRQAEIESKANGRTKCIRAIRRRYLTADIDEADVIKQLQALGLDEAQTFEIRDELRCELSYRSKEVTAAMLCEWHGNGLIDDAAYKKRLIRVGYHEKDAERIIKTCEVKAEKKGKGKKGNDKPKEMK